MDWRLAVIGNTKLLVTQLGSFASDRHAQSIYVLLMVLLGDSEAVRHDVMINDFLAIEI